MVSSAIWEKHAGVSFSKTSKIFYVLEKLMSACISQISRETILLLDNELYMEMIKAPSTRTRVNLKPGKYFHGYAYRPHVTG